MSRYNGQQPYGYYGGHDGYNPANDGWTHTGSNAQSKADFYERDNVKMDYYPSTVAFGAAQWHLCLRPQQLQHTDLA